MPSVFDVAAYNATVNKVYDEEILDKYSDEDWIKIIPGLIMIVTTCLLCWSTPGN